MSTQTETENLTELKDEQQEAQTEPQVADEQQPVTDEPQPKTFWGRLDKVADILSWVVIVALIALSLTKIFFVSTITVVGRSMENPYTLATYGIDATYTNNNKVTVFKPSKPKRGQVAVFYKYPIDSKFIAYFASPRQSESDGKYAILIKRVVAVEGDAIWIEPYNGKYRLVIQTPDGQIIYEDYYTDRQGNPIAPVLMVKTEYLADYTVDNKLLVPEGCFFAMGDNREDSLDSRGSTYFEQGITFFTFDRVVGVVVD